MTDTYINSYRKKKRQPAQHPTDQITDRQLVASAAYRPACLRSAEDEAMETLPNADITAAMQVLPEQFRIAVYFADVAGFSYKEVATIMDTEQGTVSSRLNRGRRQLRALLTETPNQQQRPETSPHQRGTAERRTTVNGAARGAAPVTSATLPSNFAMMLPFRGWCRVGAPSWQLICSKIPSEDVIA
jgi:RNA polymerase sigma-70 factor (ECF subfamily)